MSVACDDCQVRICAAAILTTLDPDYILCQPNGRLGFRIRDSITQRSKYVPRPLPCHTYADVCIAGADGRCNKDRADPSERCGTGGKSGCRACSIACFACGSGRRVTEGTGSGYLGIDRGACGSSDSQQPGSTGELCQRAGKAASSGFVPVEARRRRS